MKFLIALIFSLLVIANISSQTTTNKADIKELYKMMSGKFNSKAQSERDSDYYHISLIMTPIWKEKKGEYWLYVEQAVASLMDKPYRQRIYQLVQIDDQHIESRVYTLKNPEKTIGEWKKKKKAGRTLTLSDIELKGGCAILLSKIDHKQYAGETGKNGCPSNLRGANYATSKVKIFPKLLESWDQGFDTKEAQVWGATKGPYQFIKTGK